MMPTEVLAEFGTWLDEWHDCPAKRWVQEHPPTRYDAEVAIIVVQNVRPCVRC